MPKPTPILEELKRILSKASTGIAFKPGPNFYWSPEASTIFYVEKKMSTKEGLWSLLHESGHAKLGHSIYKTDFELLTLESAAWKEAEELAKSLDIQIDEDHIQNCLDTYRDWLHKRSTCPRCGLASLQSAPSKYNCHNCLLEWSVSQERFCRPYRRVNHGKRLADSV